MRFKNRVYMLMFIGIVFGIFLTVLFSQAKLPLSEGSDISSVNFNAICYSAVNRNAKALSTLKSLAESGNAQAQYKLGRIYESKDKQEAAKWYLRAAEQGIEKTFPHLYSIAKELNYFDAFQCLVKNAKKDDFKMQRLVGILYSMKDSKFYNQTEAVKCFDNIIKAAEQGNAEAQYQLAIMYRDGNGVKKDNEKQLIWHNKAAEQGNIIAQWQFGHMYQYGHDVNKDYKKALYWYNKAAEQDNTDALFNLGDIYDHGYCGVTKDRRQAFDFYLRAAEKGHHVAQSRLSSMYEEGEVVPKNNYEAAKWRLIELEQDDDDNYDFDYGVDLIYYRAEKGDSEELAVLRELANKDYDDAQYYLGFMHQRGRGVKKDYKEAAKWYAKAYKLGNTKVISHNIEELCEIGIPEAVEVIKDLAEKGNDYAQALLGQAYTEGRGIEKNYNEALKWLHKSAEQNNDFGKYSLGRMYYNGFGVEQNYVMAAKLFYQASRKGLLVAVAALSDANVIYGRGIIYRDGIDVKQDKKLAFEMFCEAAAKGSIEANFTLGEMYEYGKDVKKDYNKALEYYSNAAKSGHLRAIAKLRFFAEKGNINAVRNLKILDGKAEFSKDDYYEFVKICESGSIENFIEKFTKEKLLPNAKYTSQGWGEITLLTLASEHSSNVEIVKFLLREGAEINPKKITSITNVPLIRAVCNKISPKSTVQVLLQAGANVNTKDASGFTALMLAADRNYTDVIELLLQAGAKVDIKDNAGETALIYAAQESTPDVVKKLLDAGANINVQNELGETALIRAATQNSPEVVEVLLNAGANVNLKAISAYDDSTYLAIDVARGNPKLEGTKALRRLEEATKSFDSNAYITGDKVNVRAKPNTSSKIIKQLNTGHPVKADRKASNKSGDWYFIHTASGTEGWVFGKYIKFNK